jgi:hypothetical protein
MAGEANKRQMNCCKKECTLQGMRIYRGEVTFRYRKYCPAIPVCLRGISDGLVEKALTTLNGVPCFPSGTYKTPFGSGFSRKTF